MESDKRKRKDDGEMDGKRAERGKDIIGGESKVTAEEEAEVTAEEEAEVEEFFAILKRIQVAVKYFEKANGGGRKVTTGNEWRPCFVLEDFEVDNDVKNQGKREDSEEDSGFDLNLEPVSKEQGKIY